MNKEELENELKNLVSRTLAASGKAEDVFTEARTLGLQGAAVQKALDDLKAGKSEADVLTGLEQTVAAMDTKEVEEADKQAGYVQQAEEDLLSQEAKEAADSPNQ